jgi:CRISPR-associated protein Cmr3
MRMFLEPTEPLLFRTGRSFDAGESSFADTLFPPTPETLQGAVRAAIATYWDTSKTLEEVFLDPKLTDLIGSRGSGYGRFRITGLALGRRKDDKTVERLFLPPAHLLTVKDAQGIEIPLVLKPQKMLNVRSDLGREMHYLVLEYQRDEKREPFEDWLTELGLKKVLNSDLQLTDDDTVCEKDIFRRESRLGIGMDNATKTTREGYLYQTQVIRMQPSYGFVIDIRLRKAGTSPGTPFLESLMVDTQTQETLRLPDKGWIMLGGERRTARFEVLPSPTNGLEQLKQGKLVYLATPAALDGGWQTGLSLASPIAAAIDRYKTIGGWELNPVNSGGNNKIARRCVPAGSVYFFQDSVSLTQPLTDHGMEIGYGITFTGGW